MNNIDKMLNNIIGSSKKKKQTNLFSMKPSKPFFNNTKPFLKRNMFPDLKSKNDTTYRANFPPPEAEYEDPGHTRVNLKLVKETPLVIDSRPTTFGIGIGVSNNEPTIPFGLADDVEAREEQEYYQVVDEDNKMKKPPQSYQTKQKQKDIWQKVGIHPGSAKPHFPIKYETPYKQITEELKAEEVPYKDFLIKKGRSIRLLNEGDTPENRERLLNLAHRTTWRPQGMGESDKATNFHFYTRPKGYAIVVSDSDEEGKKNVELLSSERTSTKEKSKPFAYTNLEEYQARGKIKMLRRRFGRVPIEGDKLGMNMELIK